MAVRVDGWKMHIGIKKDGSWWNEKVYPNVPYLFNLLMDPMEKIDPESHEWGYAGRKFFAPEIRATYCRRSLYRGPEHSGLSPASGSGYSELEEKA